MLTGQKAEYSTVLFRIFTAQKAGSASPTDDSASTSEYDVIDSILGDLGTLGYLVAGDIEAGCIWLFENQWNKQPIQEVPHDRNLPNIEGYTLHLVTKGLLKVSELPRARFRAVAGTKSPLTPRASLSSSVLRALVSNQKACQGNAAIGDISSGQTPATELDQLAVYSWFIAAVESAVARQLAFTGGLIPLNGRTFITSDASRSTYQSPSEEEQESEDVEIVSLSTYVTTGGVLVLSFSSTSRPDIRHLHPTFLIDSNTNRLVRLSPSGVLAKYIGATGERQDDRATSQKRLRANAGPFSGLKWKKDVKGWLLRRGINLEHIDPTESWVEVQLSQDAWSSRSYFDESSNGNPGILKCHWPAALCFYYYASPPSRTKVLASEGLRWFQVDEQDHYVDPLAVAQDWFLGKPERDNAREPKRQAQTSNQDQMTLQDTNMLYPASPFYARADLQAANGVYPTPPDAILTHPSTSGMSSDGALTVTSGADLQRTNSDTLEITVPAIMKQEESGDTKQASSPLDNENDLFGDMDVDDDNFGGNELPEADFNFFDEPDDDDEDLVAPGDEPDEDPEHMNLDQPSSKLESAPHESSTGQETLDASQEDDRVDSIDDSGHMIPQSPPDASDRAEAQCNDEADAEAMEKVAESPAQQLLASPPISPVMTRKQLVSSQPPLDQSSTGQATVARRKSLYDTVSFNQKVNTTDSKYAAGGVFGFSPIKTGRGTLGAAKPDGMSAHTRDADTEPALPSLGRTQPVFDPHKIKSSQSSNNSSHPMKSVISVARIKIIEDSDSEDASTVVSSDGIATWEEEVIVKHEQEAIIRKRPRTDDATSTASSPPASASADEKLPKMDELALNIKEAEVLSVFDQSYGDWDLSRLPAPKSGSSSNSKSAPPPFNHSSQTQIPQSSQDAAAQKLQGLQGRAIISIAQILAEQVALTVLQMVPDTPSTPSNWDGLSGSNATRPPLFPQTTFTNVFHGIGASDVVKYAQIQDAPFEPPPGAKPQPKPPQRKGGPSASVDPTVFSLHPQHVRLRRGDLLWDLLPTALAFWEPLGLAPRNGPKNVMSYCVHPFNEDLIDPLSSFLDCLGAAYDSCKLGAHVRGVTVGDFGTGLVSVDVSSIDRPTRETAVKAMRETCVELGKLLATADLAPTEKTLQESAQTKLDEDAPRIGAFVIYIVNPFEEATSLRDICACFWALSQTYEQACRTLSPLDRKPELVLQILPIKYVASVDAPVVPSPQLLAALAREVYDRIPPSSIHDNFSLSIRTLPSIQLEETLPRTIQFRLTADPPGDLLHDCSHLHIGYATDWDGDWLAVAWTDNCGKYQHLSAYSLRNGRTFADAAREVWQATLAIIQVRKVTWRISIARAGVMDKDEIEGKLPSTELQMTLVS